MRRLLPGTAALLAVFLGVVTLLVSSAVFDSASLAYFSEDRTLSLILRTSAYGATLTSDTYNVVLYDTATVRPWQALRCKGSSAVACTSSVSSLDAYIPAATLNKSATYADKGVFVVNMTSDAPWVLDSTISVAIYTASGSSSTPAFIFDTPTPILPGTVATFDPLPPPTSEVIFGCSDGDCSKAEYKCFPVGGNPAAAVPCEEFDFPACPTMGCGPQLPVRRTVACYEGFDRLHLLSLCDRNPPPPSVRECPPIYESCAGYIALQAECLDSANVAHNCSSGPRDVSFRRGECRDTTGVVVSSSWCRYEKTNVMCNLPPCNRRWEARWFASEPSPCYSGPDATCASYRTVDVACRYTLLSDSPGSYPTANSVWIDTALSACDQRSAPARLIRCSASTPMSLTPGTMAGPVISRCLNGGVCRMSDVFVSGEHYASAKGQCQCPLGFSGLFCGTAAWVRGVTASVFAFGAKRYSIAWESNPEAPPNTLATVTLRRVGNSFNATAAQMALLATAALPVARVRLSYGGVSLDPQNDLDLLPGSWIATVRVSQALQASSVSFTITPRCEGRCVNGGACDAQTALCVCPRGYSGDRCEKTPCDTSGCNVFATCKDQPDGSFQCTCPTSPVTGLPLLQGPTCGLPYDLGLCPPDLDCKHGGHPDGSVNSHMEAYCPTCACPNNWHGSGCETCLQRCYNGADHNSDCTGCDCTNTLGYHGADCRCRYVTVTLNFPASSVPWLSLPASAPVSARAREEAKYRWGKLLSHEIMAFMRGAEAPKDEDDDFALAAVIGSYRPFNTTAGVKMLQMMLRVGANCLAGNNGLLGSVAPAPPTAVIGESGDATTGLEAGVFISASVITESKKEPPVAGAIIGGPSVLPIEMSRVYVTLSRLRTSLSDGSAAGTEILKSFDLTSGVLINDPLCVDGVEVDVCPSGTGRNAQMDEWTPPQT